MDEEECIKVMEEYEEQERKRYAFQERSDNRLLKVLTKMKGEAFIGGLKACIKDSENVGTLKIVHSTENGQWQEEGYEDIDGIWVDQHSVGESGDSFAGSVYVKIKDKKFLRFNYYM